MWLRPRDHCFFEIMLHKILHEFNLFFVPIALDPLFTQELKADVVRFVESRVILPNSHFEYRARPSGTVRGFVIQLRCRYL